MSFEATKLLQFKRDPSKARGMMDAVFTLFANGDVVIHRNY